MLHAMRTGDMKQEMGTGPWAFKGNYRQLQVARGLVLPPPGEEKFESHPRSRQSGWPEKVVSGQSHSFRFSGWRRKAGAWRCWSCWGQAQRWFHPFDSHGLVLICKAVLSILSGKENTPLPGAGMGTGSHWHTRSRGAMDAAAGKSSFPFQALWQPVLTPVVSHLATGLVATACKIENNHWRNWVSRTRIWFRQGWLWNVEAGLPDISEMSYLGEGNMDR